MFPAPTAPDAWLVWLTVLNQGSPLGRPVTFDQATEPAEDALVADPAVVA